MADEVSQGAKELREILSNLLDEKLRPIRASISIAIEQGQSNSKTMGQICKRLEGIEKQLFITSDTLPSEPLTTVPEQERPSEAP